MAGKEKLLRRIELLQREAQVMAHPHSIDKDGILL